MVQKQIGGFWLGSRCEIRGILGFLIFCDISGVYAISGEKDFFVLYQAFSLFLLGIDKRAVSRNERSNENAKKAPAEENRTPIFDTGMK